MIETKWYEMPGALNFEDNPLYFEKIESDFENDASIDAPKKIGFQKKVTNSWTKKRRYKGKMQRKFFSTHPDIDYSTLEGGSIRSAIVDLRLLEPQKIFFINYNTHVFVDKRGVFRKLSGTVQKKKNMLAIGSLKSHYRNSNRLLRRSSNDDFSPVGARAFYRKLYSPGSNGLW